MKNLARTFVVSLIGTFMATGALADVNRPERFTDRNVIMQNMSARYLDGGNVKWESAQIS